MAFLLTSQTNQRTNKGFTLIELIVVIAIIAVLAVLGFGAYMLGIERARIARAQGDLDKIKKAVLQLELDTTYHPGSVSTSSCSPAHADVILDNTANTGLSIDSTSVFGSTWKGTYTDNVPEADPWGKPYYLRTQYPCSSSIKGCGSYAGTVRILFSQGPDGLSADAATYADDIVTVLCK